MNKKRLVISSLVALIVVAGSAGAAYVLMSQNYSADQHVETAPNEVADTTEGEATAEADIAEVTPGRYVTLDEYQAAPDTYVSSTKVYFFHAPWCPVCKGIDEEIVADTSQLPDDVTLIKTDYDANTELRQKYGVTYQYTFVQVDDNGDLVKKYTATSYEAVVQGIET